MGSAGMPLDSPLAGGRKVFNFYKEGSSLGIKHNLSQEGSQSPSASATPQLSIQQDSHKRNVYHIYGKDAEAEFNNA